MTKKTSENQVVEEKEGFASGDGYPNCEGEPCANMAEETKDETDTVAEESVAAEQTEEQTEDTPKTEEIDWKDRYIRLQAEFDNFRKRTLREKMALIESGGSDVWKAVLPVLDDMERAIAASRRARILPLCARARNLSTTSLSILCDRRVLWLLRLLIPSLIPICTRLWRDLLPVRRSRARL